MPVWICCNTGTCLYRFVSLVAPDCSLNPSMMIVALIPASIIITIHAQAIAASHAESEAWRAVEEVQCLVYRRRCTD